MQPGKQLGSYEILSALDPGGTGDVYRARDGREQRDVALRILPEPVSPDEDSVARLRLGVETLAGLDHPHIAHVHGLEEAEGTRFLVTELVEGESLRDRFKRGAIPEAESLALALQIAQALEAAHGKGVIHRDLNPENIRITPDGQVKLRDFGIAGLAGATQTSDAAAGSDPHLSHSPTLSQTAAGSGMFSGTAAYMAPEQARGEAADAQADVWAFGCVLYEMLAGSPAFQGKSEADVRAAVLRSDPDWDRLPGGVHPRVRFLLERCLEKDTTHRASSMADVRAGVEKTLEDPADSAIATGSRAASMLPWVGAVVLAGILGLGGTWALRSDDVQPVVRFRTWASQPGAAVPTLQAVSPELGISRDGSRIVFKGLDGRLYFRDRDDMASRPVQITEETASLYAPFFSPDGRELYFVDVLPPATLNPAVAAVFPRSLLMGEIPEPGLDLKTVPVDGGAPRPVLTDRDHEVLDPNWSTDSTILFTDSRGRIQTVAANGGEPETLLEAGAARYPQLLPGGDWVLYSIGDLVPSLAQGTPLPPGEIVVQSLADPEDRRVVQEGGTQARYVPSTGHVVYIGTSEPGLWAFPFDAGRLEKTGDPVPLVEDLIVDFDISDTGSLTYARAVGIDPTIGASGNSGNEVLALINRTGGAVRRLRVDPGGYLNPRVSPDGTRVAYEFVGASGESQIRVYDLVEDSPRILASDGQNTYPIWKDDGIVTFASDRSGEWEVYSQPADGSGNAEVVVSAPSGTVYRPQAWSPDGTLVLVVASAGGGPRTGRLAMLPPDGGEVVEIPLAEDGADEFGATVSPDGTLLAYLQQCGSFPGCVRAQRFPPVPGSSFEVDQGSAWIFFSPDGSELLSLDQQTSLEVRRVASSGGAVEFPVFGRISLGQSGVLTNRSFDLRGPGGLELVMVVPSDVAETSPDDEAGAALVGSEIDFFYNFFDVLRERVRASGR